MKKYYVTNPETEIAVFEKTGKLAVINNTKEERHTDLYLEGILKMQLTLAPMEMRWITYKEEL